MTLTIGVSNSSQDYLPGTTGHLIASAQETDAPIVVAIGYFVV